MTEKIGRLVGEVKHNSHPAHAISYAVAKLPTGELRDVALEPGAFAFRVKERCFGGHKFYMGPPSFVPKNLRRGQEVVVYDVCTLTNGMLTAWRWALMSTVEESSAVYSVVNLIQERIPQSDGTVEVINDSQPLFVGHGDALGDLYPYACQRYGENNLCVSILPANEMIVNTPVPVNMIQFMDDFRSAKEKAKNKTKSRSQPVLAKPIPVEPVLAKPIPVEPVLAKPIPVEPVLAEPVPAEPVSSEPVPAEMTLDEEARRVLAQLGILDAVMAQLSRAE